MTDNTRQAAPTEGAASPRPPEADAARDLCLLRAIFLFDSPDAAKRGAAVIDGLVLDGLIASESVIGAVQ